MICSWRWFIHPATAISMNRNGSRTLGISLAYYREPWRIASPEKCYLKQDPISGPYGAPIVSVSLGLPAVFFVGGKRRSNPVRRLRLESGDIVVWGGPARFVYHGVSPLKNGQHPLTGTDRINLTFRKVC